MSTSLVSALGIDIDDPPVMMAGVFLVQKSDEDPRGVAERGGVGKRCWQKVAIKMPSDASDARTKVMATLGSLRKRPLSKSKRTAVKALIAIAGPEALSSDRMVAHTTSRKVEGASPPSK